MGVSQAVYTAEDNTDFASILQPRVDNRTPTQTQQIVEHDVKKQMVRRLNLGMEGKWRVSDKQDVFVRT
jgi:hypothetical protein